MAETEHLQCCNIAHPCGQSEICCRIDDCGISCPPGEVCCGSNTIRPANGSNPIISNTTCTTDSACYNTTNQTPCGQDHIIIDPGVCIPGGTCSVNSTCCDPGTIRPNDGSDPIISNTTCTTDSACYNTTTQLPCGDYLTSDPPTGTCQNLCLVAQISACSNSDPIDPPFNFTLGCWEANHGTIAKNLHAPNQWTAGLIEECQQYCINQSHAAPTLNQVMVTIALLYESEIV